MTRLGYIALLTSSLLACGEAKVSPTSPASQSPEAPQPTKSAEVETTSAPPEEEPARPAPTAGSAEEESLRPPPTEDAGPKIRPAKEAEMAKVAEREAILAPSKSWPFLQWDKAQAFTFNLQKPGPGTKLRVYSASQGWTKTPTPGPLLSAKQSKQALKLLKKTQGEMIVSKCPFPRHGIVFFQGEFPVGSISVCFECGDIMIWPNYSQAADWDEQKSKRFGKLMKAYERAFPGWKKLFEGELGLPSDWKMLPQVKP